MLCLTARPYTAPETASVIVHEGVLKLLASTLATWPRARKSVAVHAVQLIHTTSILTVASDDDLDDLLAAAVASVMDALAHVAPYVGGGEERGVSGVDRSRRLKVFDIHTACPVCRSVGANSDWTNPFAMWYSH